MSEPKPKSFDISKRAVWEAWLRVKANKGAAGVDEQSITEFERDLQGNLYKLWNRLSSGSYMPPPVRAVEIPKRDGSPRVLGVPTVADRIAQTVVRGYLEPGVEPFFHADSYGYRPGRSALDAVGVCRERCWKLDWGKRRDKPAWRRDMKTSYVEGVAIHDGLESCAGVREDAGEALTEGDVGWVIEPRNHLFGVPTPSQWSEGNIAGRVSASCWRTPRGQRACACVESPSARTGRSHGCPSGCDGRAGRSGKARAVSPR